MFAKIFNNLFKAQTNKVPDIVDRRNVGLFQEDPKLAEMTRKAKEKMAIWGRKSLLEGGQFNKHETILRGRNTLI